MAKRVTPRPEVMRFALEMEKKLRANDHKGGWENENYSYLFDGITREAKELENVLDSIGIFESTNPKISKEKKLEIIGECADIANFAMMIFDNTNR